VIRGLRHYCLIPITPIHIGDGNELDPTQYVIRGRRLERFDPVATIAGLSEADRRKYLRALNEGELSRAQRLLQGAASRGASEIVSLLSDRSGEELQQALESPNRSGSFKTIIRSGGRAIIPGSTVKGALRTGLLHLEAERRHVAFDQIEHLIKIPGRSGRASDALQRIAFALPDGATERDPMRDVSVADAVLDEESTQIDQVVDWKRDRSGEFTVPNQQFQLHVERIFSLADQLGDRKVAPISVAIAVTGPQVLGERRALERKSERLGPDRSPDFAALLQGANAHHIAVWKLERQRFFFGPLGGKTAALLDACLDALGIGDIDALARDEAPRSAMIRLGWAGHFESKSVAAVRRGYRPQARGEEGAEVGSTRHGIMLSGVFIPFGWAVLIPEEEAPATLPAIAAAGLTRRLGSPMPVPGAPSRAFGTGSTASGLLLFRKGDRLRNEDGELGTVTSDVKAGEDTMTIEIGGDLETVKVTEWRKA
jgi:CRISPR-associated protein Csm5